MGKAVARVRKNIKAEVKYRKIRISCQQKRCLIWANLEVIYSKIGGSQQGLTAPLKPPNCKVGIARWGDALLKTNAQIKFLYYPLDILILKLVILLTLSSSELIIILLTLARLKLTLFISTNSEQVTVNLQSLGKILFLKKQSKPSPFDTKFKNHAWSLAQVIFNDPINGNQELGSPVNK